jgi:cytidylate kinase
MASQRSVVFNGDLGSGKTTVSRMLAEQLGLRRISIGDLYREMALQRGMTALQLNLHAELDDKIDHLVDQLQRDIATSGEQLVVDSRLAWHFFGDALKVHLITDSAVAAERVYGRPSDTVESYLSPQQALQRLASRSESERHRFLTRYGVDKSRLRNYDLVCDTTVATPAEVVQRIVAYLRGGDPAPGVTMCYLDPRRIRPTADRGASPAGDTDAISVGYSAPHFFAVDGRARLCAAVEEGASHIPAVLVAEGAEELDGTTCEQYFAEHAT